MTNTAKTTTAHDAAVAAMREAGYKIDAEESYENLAAEFGWDAIERGENPDRFLTEADFGGDADQDFPDWNAEDAEAFNAWWDEQAAAAAAEADLFN